MESADVLKGRTQWIPISTESHLWAEILVISKVVSSEVLRNGENGHKFLVRERERGGDGCPHSLSTIFIA